MAVKPNIQIKYSPVRTYPGSVQVSSIGQNGGSSGGGTMNAPYPNPTNSNFKFVSKIGSDGGAGTSSDPYLTIGKALATLGGAFIGVKILDSGVYTDQKLIWNVANSYLVGTPGKNPVIEYGRGVGITGSYTGTNPTYGARNSHPTYDISAAQAIAFVSKNGNNATAVIGNSSLRFLTIQAAVSALAATGLGVFPNFVALRIMDSQTYIEDITASTTNFYLKITSLSNQTPTLQNVLTGSGNSHISLTGAGGSEQLELFGIRLDEAKNSAGTAVNSSNFLSLTDCTISNGTNGLVAVYLQVSNCVFQNMVNAINCQNTSGGNTTGSTITNSIFSSTKGGTGIFMGAPVANTNSGASPLTVNFCSFIGWGNNFKSSVCIDRDYTGTVIGGVGRGFTANDTVSNCLFDGYYAGIQWGQPNQYCTGAGQPTISNCSFVNGRRAMRFASTTAGATVTEVLCRNNVGYDLLVLDGGMGSNLATVFTLTNFASLNCGCQDEPGAIHLQQGLAPAFPSSTPVTVTTTLNLNNSVILNAQHCGVRAYSSIPNVPALSTGCFIKVAALNSIVNKCHDATFFSDNSTGNLCQYQTSLISTCFDVAPNYAAASAQVLITIDYPSCPIAPANFLSTVPGYENLALDPNSPCLFNGTANAGDDIGLTAAAFEIQANRVFVDNISFRSNSVYSSLSSIPDGHDSVNMRGAVRVAPGFINSSFTYCTFQRFGLYGAKISRNNFVYNCEFRDASVSGASACGNGIILNGGNSVVAGSTFINCGGAGILNGDFNNAIRNNSAYSCEYGQFDVPWLTETVTGACYASSGVYDYFGSGTLTNSCVGTFPATAQLISGNQLDPLFRNPDAGDLRLQTLEFSYAYESPAKGIGLNGGDAGAFLMTYQALQLLWTTKTLDLNPDNIPVFEEPVFLAEGDLVSGGLYTFAEAYRQGWHFQWGHTNPMSANDLATLLALFQSSTGESQLSFDNGATFIATRVRRKTGFEYVDIDDLYNQDKPTPVRTVDLVASA